VAIFKVQTKLILFMQKLLLLISLLVFTSFTVVAQTDTLSAKDKALLDSMMENDEFLKLMEEKPKNTVDISLGMGNGAFSQHNNAANATGVVKQIIFMPSVMYRTKEGFVLGVTGFLTQGATGKTALYQTGVTAGYDYYDKKMLTGISYTRYLSDKNKYNSKALYQNDIYGYIKKAKGLLRPGLSLGFANGNYKEVDYTSFILKRPFRGDTLITGKDSTDNKVNYFSVSANVAHDFRWYKLFSKNDELDFVPSLIVNFGSDKFIQTHTNKIYDRIRKLNTIKKAEITNKFQLQSIAASFDFTYGVGKFFLQPNLYLDYYLPETSSNRLSAVFSVIAGLTF
jgi:hypothetical protein